MTKVDIKRLDSVTANDTTATALINDNFKALQDAIENALSRDGSTPNFMDADLDLNSYKIINCGEAVEDNDVVTLKYVEEAIGNAAADAQSAANSAKQAASSAQSASVSATNAVTAVRNAETTISQANELLKDTQTYVDAAKVDIDAAVAQGKTDIDQYVTDAEDEVKLIARDEANKAIANAAAEATKIATENMQPLVDEAADSATAAKASQTAAKTSETNAKQSETNALSSKNAAASSATSASNYANNSKIWAEGTDSQVQALGGTKSAKGWAEASENLNYTDITNCIIAAPNNIKLELNNGTLTLKAGSKVYDGAGNVINITSNLLQSAASDRTFIGFVYNGNSFIWEPLDRCFSGDTYTGSVSGNVVWYDTANKIVKRSTDGGSSWLSGTVSLPFVIITGNGTNVASIDQVFNGFGYIGSTIFALPGVEGLIPNGWSDKYRNNIKFKTTSVLTSTRGLSGNLKIYLRNNFLSYSSGIYYNEEANENRGTDNDAYSNMCEVGTLTADSTGRITEFNPKLPIRLADDQEVVHKTGNEEIDGVKTFLKRLTSIAPNIDANVIPSSSIYNDFIVTMDKTVNNQLGYFGNAQYSNGNILSRIGTSRRKKDGSYIHTEISVGTTTDGTIFTNTPTPALSSNSSDIVNTSWFNQKIKVVNTLPSSPDANVFYFVTNA